MKPKKTKMTKKPTSMEELLSMVPDTGFTHGAKSNKDAEYVASNPEDWEPVILLSRGRPKKGATAGFTQKNIRIPNDMMKLIERKAKQENLPIHAAMRQAILNWAQDPIKQEQLQKQPQTTTPTGRQHITIVVDQTGNYSPVAPESDTPSYAAFFPLCNTSKQGEK